MKPLVSIWGLPANLFLCFVSLQLHWNLPTNALIHIPTHADDFAL